MDALKDKSYKKYNAISRYTQFPYYYNKNDEKYIYGLTAQLDTEIEYVLHKVEYYDTLDSLALKYYGRPDYYWIIADYNRISDPFVKLITIKKQIKIPSLSNIKFE